MITQNPVLLSKPFLAKSSANGRQELWLITLALQPPAQDLAHWRHTVNVNGMEWNCPSLLNQLVAQSRLKLGVPWLAIQCYLYLYITITMYVDGCYCPAGSYFSKVVCMQEETLSSTVRWQRFTVTGSAIMRTRWDNAFLYPWWNEKLRGGLALAVSHDLLLIFSKENIDWSLCFYCYFKEYLTPWPWGPVSSRCRLLQS